MLQNITKSKEIHNRTNISMQVDQVKEEIREELHDTNRDEKYINN